MSTPQPSGQLPLTTLRANDKRPQWEPPILDCSELIDPKRREAVLKFTGNDAARTTKILDILDERELYWMYQDWLERGVVSDGDAVERHFYLDLMKELGRDHEEVRRSGWDEQDLIILRDGEGKWEVREIPRIPRIPRSPPELYKSGNKRRSRSHQSRHQSCVEGTDAGASNAFLALHQEMKTNEKRSGKSWTSQRMHGRQCTTCSLASSPTYDASLSLCSKSFRISSIKLANTVWSPSQYLPERFGQPPSF